MARARDRAPSQHAYRGAAGATRTGSFHVTMPDGALVATRGYLAVDVITDPELGQRLLAEDPAHGLNLVRDQAGQAVALSVPVVYHDPAAEIFVLVASPGDRHRELELRSKLLAELAADPASPVPAYVRDAAVVFGAAGLRGHLEQLAERALASQRAADHDAEHDRRRTELASREAEAERRQVRTGERMRELDRRAADLDQREAAVDQRLSEVEGREVDLARRQHELEAAHSDLQRRWQEVERLRSEVALRSEALDQARTTPVRIMRGSEPPAPTRSERVTAAAIEPARLARATEPPPASSPSTSPARVARSSQAPDIATPPARAIEIQSELTTVARPELAPPEAETTNPFELVETGQTAALPGDEAGPGEPVAPLDVLPASADPLTTVTFELPIDQASPHRGRRTGAAVGDAVARRSIDGERAGLWLGVPATSAPALAHGALDVRLQLHRHPAHAVIAVVVGTPLAVRGLSPHRVVAFLDPTADSDARWLASLEHEFVLDLELAVDDQAPLRRVRLVAPLADNTRFITRAAGDHQRGLPGGATALVEAVTALAAAEHDLLGLQHPEHGELRIDKLENLATANQVRRALAIARRFSRPVREDYLVTVRGFPLPHWNQLRKTVLARAIACGLWMGPDLAQLAIASGLAISPTDLWARLEAGFAGLLADAAANDLDPDAIEDNRAALAQEATQLGITSAGASAGDVFASGTIARKTVRNDLARAPIAELLTMLDDRARRLDAAIELCGRRDPAAIRPLMAAIRRMSRAEAVRALGAMVKFGPAAAPALTAGLASSKAFLRHGCALALALVKDDEGTEAVIDVLLAEPTEIWREIARAVGQVGPAALMPLAARVGRMGDRATVGARERLSWAMAHVAVRGGKAAVETLAHGVSAVAPVARMALERMSAASQDDVAVRDGPARDVTVNRAFSRRFFEVTNGGGDRPPSVGAAPANDDEPLDDDDLLIDLDSDSADDAAELDESDLIPG